MNLLKAREKRIYINHTLKREVFIFKTPHSQYWSDKLDTVQATDIFFPQRSTVPLGYSPQFLVEKFSSFDIKLLKHPVKCSWLHKEHVWSNFYLLIWFPRILFLLRTLLLNVHKCQDISDWQIKDCGVLWISGSMNNVLWQSKYVCMCVRAGVRSVTLCCSSYLR